MTLSRAQHEFVSKRIADAGLGDRASVRLADYREIAATAADQGAYDAVSSDRDGRARRGRRVPGLRPDPARRAPAAVAGR